MPLEQVVPRALGVKAPSAIRNWPVCYAAQGLTLVLGYIANLHTVTYGAFRSENSGATRCEHGPGAPEHRIGVTHDGRCAAGMAISSTYGAPRPSRTSMWC